MRPENPTTLPSGHGGDPDSLPAGATVDVPKDRRSGDRRSVRLPLRYRFPLEGDNRWNHGVVLNLSETGGCFLVDGAWDHVDHVDGADGFRIEVEVGDGRGRSVHLAGGVVWIRPDGGGGEGVDRIGVSFTDVSDADHLGLRSLLGR